MRDCPVVFKYHMPHFIAESLPGQNHLISSPLSHFPVNYLFTLCAPPLAEKVDFVAVETWRHLALTACLDCWNRLNSNTNQTLAAASTSQSNKTTKYVYI